MIALVDYGIGNLRSVQKALQAVGGQVVLTDQADRILDAERVVLPGVGAFGDGMKRLQARGLDRVILEVCRQGKPVLGICLGMQLLFESSTEQGEFRGLGLLPGKVLSFPAGEWKIPQTGWNQVIPAGEDPILADLPSDSYAYFNHGYYCEPADPTDVLGWTEYGIRYASVVGHGRIFGVQFHPEKSQAVGLQILQNFVHLV